MSEVWYSLKKQKHKQFFFLFLEVSKSEQGTVNIQKYKKNLQIIEENEESYLHVSKC